MSEERLNELFSMINEGYRSIQEQEIRDYITDLQEENERLKEITEPLIKLKATITIKGLQSLLKISTGGDKE